MSHHIMAKYWWILAGRGIAGIGLGLAAFWNMGKLQSMSSDLFGLSAFLKPASILATLIFLLGAYALLDGLFSIVLGAQDYGGGKRWWILIAEGILSVGLGFFAWLAPGEMVMAALYGIAGWACATGMLEIIQGMDLNEYRDRRPFFISAGICSVLFGVFILFFQVAGTPLVWVIGIYALAFGTILLAAALRLRRFARRMRNQEF